MAGNPLLKGLAPMHPGEFLREVTIPALDLPKNEIARRLEVSDEALSNILDEKQPVTAAVALRLGRFFGNGPEFWLNLQRDYDLRTLEPTRAEPIEPLEGTGKGSAEKL